MDKDLKKSIQDIAQAERLADEEKLNAGNISGIIEANEDLEDKEELIIKLRRRLKRWRISFWTGFVVLLIILLYMIYIGVSYKPEAIEPEVTQPEIVQINQAVEEYSLYYMLECPVVDKNDIVSSTIQTVAKEADDWSNCVTVANDYEYINDADLSAGFYIVNPDKEAVLASDDTVYFYESLVELFYSQPKEYSVSTEDFEVPDYSEYNMDATKGLELHVGAFEKINGRVDFYNSETASVSSPVPDDRLADIINPLMFNIVIYDGVSIDAIESAIQSALSAGTHQNIIDLYMTDSFIEDSGEKIIEAIKTVTPKFELTVTGSYYSGINQQLYSYYDSVDIIDGNVTCSKGEVEEVPEVIIKLDVTDYEILYDALACAYHFNWY